MNPVPANYKKAADVEAIVQKLADARLITTDEQAGKDTVTISHESVDRCLALAEKTSQRKS
ncbi:MAG: hypothetical protein IPL71_03990 [Anaerolineales bacterium]|uniref:hypothetical protein n=1 Tax=Candidatus Villigracilis proximus TaxID=3140683 RepID=UPI0031356F82|nr:hypothetical protein [Anaerolineales bacterium]